MSEEETKLERTVERLERSLERARSDMATGLAAIKVMLDERTSRIDRVEKKSEDNSSKIGETREKLSALEERVANVRDDVTGKHDLHLEVGKAKGKEEALKEANDAKHAARQLRNEKWKATAPIIVALVTGIFGALAAIVNLILHFTGGGGSH